MDIVSDVLEWYGGTIHPVLAIILCISGSLGHLFSIATLARMLNPTNKLLMSMSFSQLALCANFLYSTLFKWASDEACVPLFFSQPMARTMHVSVTLSILVHMAGVFHVVALSIMRYCSIRRLSGINSSLPWFTNSKCWMFLIVIYVLVTVISLPLHFTTVVHEVFEKDVCAKRFVTLRNKTSFELMLTTNKSLLQLNFWLFNLCDKIVPSIILCVMTLLILRQLKDIRSRQARFSSLQRDQQHQRMTKMILTIMFVFICVELPQGILAVASSVFSVSIYNALGDFNEMITLLTACIIFFLLCAMNSKLRQAILGAPCFVWIHELSTAARKRRRSALFEARRVCRLRSTAKDHLLAQSSVTPTPAIDKNGYATPDL